VIFAQHGNVPIARRHAAKNHEGVMNFCSKVQDTIRYERSERHITRGVNARGLEGGISNGEDIVVREVFAAAARIGGFQNARVFARGL
jgi:chorismate synthase